MKALSAALQAHLDGGTTTLAWCWRIERGDGVVFGFTDHDRELSFGGVTYEPDSGFAASEIRSGTDLAVDAQDAEGVLTSDTITETDILDGRWDNAAVEVWRVNWDAVGQRVLMLSGDHVYILYEHNEEFLSEAEKAKLRDKGRIATKADELRTVSRQLRVLELATGRLARPEWNMNLMDFAHVKGSMQERDRAIYLATNDGYLFKLYATKGKSAAGGK